METLLCPDSSPTFLKLFDFSIAPPLLFYAYIPILVLSLLFGIFVFAKDKRSPASKYFFVVTASFVLWILTILIQWTAASVYLVHFAWQLLLIPEICIYIFSIFLSYSILFQKEVSMRYVVWFAPILLFACAILPTNFNVGSFDLTNCQSNVGIGWNVVYMFELACLVIIGAICIERIKETKIVQEKRKAVLYALGVLIFLGIFWFSNFFGEITRVYEFNLIGPLGMVIFLSAISYSILRFKAFRVKLFSSQVLIIALWILTASLLFVENIEYVHVVVAITSIFILIVGIELIKSVRIEIESREKIERLAKDLEVANVKLKELDGLKSEFLSFASHQLRNPLTAVKGYASLVLEGDYGTVDPKIVEVFKTISASTQNLLVMVQEFLDISKIEQGGMKYDMGPIDIRKLVESVVDQTKPNIEIKSLTHTLTIADGASYTSEGDENKLRQVFINIIDNCIKYTPTGGLKMSLEHKGPSIVFTIVDTGVGISAEDLPKLFGKFSRAAGANKINVVGSGLGLYLAKQIIEAHRGSIKVESPGKGLGSTFTITLPSK